LRALIRVASDYFPPDLFLEPTLEARGLPGLAALPARRAEAGAARAIAISEGDVISIPSSSSTRDVRRVCRPLQEASEVQDGVTTLRHRC